MAEFNTVAFSGRLVRTPHYQDLPDGTQVCRFRLAQKRGVKMADGSRPPTDYMNCVAYRDVANAAKGREQGEHIGVEGVLRSRDWTPQGGERQFLTEILAVRLHFLETKAETQRRREGQQRKRNWPQSVEDNLSEVDERLAALRGPKPEAPPKQKKLTRAERRAANKAAYAREKKLVEQARLRMKNRTKPEIEKLAEDAEDAGVIIKHPLDPHRRSNVVATITMGPELRRRAQEKKQKREAKKPRPLREPEAFDPWANEVEIAKEADEPELDWEAEE